MGILQRHGIAAVHHYTPLHYLVFIARSRSLLSKAGLLAAGFGQEHFRSMSRSRDVARGFSEYVHLTLSEYPPIVAAKLAAGFPHLRVTLSSRVIEPATFSLCRYNIAMTRFLRRGSKRGSDPSSTNGRYYEDLQIPVARTEADKLAMLEVHLPARTMIEVLIRGEVALEEEINITCYSADDAEIATEVLAAVGRQWNVVTAPASRAYPRNARYVSHVREFLRRALADPKWRGDGLEFDRV